MKTVVFTAALVFILAPPALANCLTDSIGDNSPRALERYLHCREMESRIETLERAQQDRANAERVHQEGERDRRCITITKTTEQYFDCVRAGRPKVTKEQFEDVRRHLFPETQTPELKPACATVFRNRPGRYGNTSTKNEPHFRRKTVRRAPA